MKIRDRIKEFRRVKASDLLPNPKNWRTHPKAQQDALRSVLAEIGYADAVIAYETKNGLMLIDGHLRADTTPDSEVPVLVLDVNEEEADKLLVVLDPLSAMAGADIHKMDELLRGLDFQNEALREMISKTHENNLQNILDELSKKAEADSEEEDKDSLEEGSGIDQYTSFSVPVTAKQEIVVRGAISVAKELFSCSHSGEALTRALEDWQQAKGK